MKRGRDLEIGEFFVNPPPPPGRKGPFTAKNLHKRPKPFTTLDYFSGVQRGGFPASGKNPFFSFFEKRRKNQGRKGRKIKKISSPALSPFPV